MKKRCCGSLVIGLVLLFGSAGSATAAVVGVGTADDSGMASVCVASDPPMSGDEIKELLERNVTVSQGQVESISAGVNQATILVPAAPGTPVDATVPDEVASANGLSDCTEVAGAGAAAGGGFMAIGPPGGALSEPGVGIAALTVIGVGGIFGGLCAAGEIGCGGGGDGQPPLVIPPGPPPPPPVEPPPPPRPRPRPRPVSPSR